jgi:hypothetical protein
VLLCGFREASPENGGDLFCTVCIIDTVEAWKSVGSKAFVDVIRATEQPIFAHGVQSKRKVEVRKPVKAL